MAMKRRKGKEAAGKNGWPSWLVGGLIFVCVLVIGLAIARSVFVRVAVEDTIKKGNACLEEEDFEGARETFMKVLAKDPNNWRANYVLAGMCAFHSDPPDLSLAEGYIEKAIAKHRTADALIVLAKVREGEGKSEKAEELYQEAYELGPRSKWVCYNYACLLWRQERYSEAAAYYGRALEVDPECSEAKKWKEKCEKLAKGSRNKWRKNAPDNLS